MKELTISAFLLVHVIIFIGGLSRLNTTLEKTVLSGILPHFIAFFTLAFVSSVLLLSYKKIHPFLISFLYAVFIGILLEFSQLLIGYRMFDVFDMLMDTVGAGCYFLVGYILYKNGFFEILKRFE